MHPQRKTYPLLNRAGNAWRSGGLRAVSFGVLHAAGCRTAGWLACDLEQARTPIRCPPTVAYRFLGADELGRLAQLRADRDMDRDHRQLARGDWCAVLQIGERIVAASWLALHEARQEYLGVTLEIPPGSVYTYGTYVHPDVRGRRYHGLLNALLRQRAAHEGAHTAHSLVGFENRSSLRAMQRLGYRQVGWILSFAAPRQRRHLCYGPGGFSTGAALTLRSPRLPPRS